MSDHESRIAVLETSLAHLQQVVIEEKRRLNGNLERIDGRLADLGEKLDAARIESLRRPTWGVTLAISTLLTAVVGLGTYLLTR